jgi:tRNA pseudouridine13 synthase
VRCRLPGGDNGAHCSSGRGGGRGGGRSGERSGNKRTRVARADLRGLDDGWEGGPGRLHARCVLCKVNKDSHAVAAALAKRLGAPTTALGLAGTKDKRGATMQWITAFKVSAARLQAASTMVPGVRLGPVSYTSQGLRLGDLAGNQFTLVLRGLEANATAPPEVRGSSTGDGCSVSQSAAPELEVVRGVGGAVAALRDSGFINFFGLQRFGTGSVPTHEIGTP